MKAAFRVVNLRSPAAPSGLQLGARQSPISQKIKTTLRMLKEAWVSLAHQSGLSNSKAMHFKWIFANFAEKIKCFISS